MWNLLSNAVKFTPDGGAISIESERLEERVAIRVRDNGAGIEPAVLPYVFDRFRQGDSSTTRPYGGLGLGLAIVKSLVELHGGTVDAFSAGERKGTVFTVLLPLQQEQASAERKVEQRTSGTLHARRLLLVEDDGETRQFLHRLMETAGAEIRSAENVEEALRIFSTWTPEAIVSDIAMPGEDGYSLIRRIRAMENGPRIPALALTAYGRPEDREEAMEAGFDRYVRKPIEPSDFLYTLAELLAGE
jgi:CheY-like chemotaxis protein/anti-sigma regulatory factor (Ser/Thr protein kinase)